MSSSKKLYIMISKTDTGIGKLIRKVTGYPYNHVSVTLDPTFRKWVSFARFHHDTPLYGGFILEPVERFLAKGETVDIRVFALDLIQERFDELRNLFSRAGGPDNGYIYNYLELLTLSLGIPCPVQNAYSCLGFANAILGTGYRSIRDLDRHMAPQLIYAGTLNDLAPDTGDRSDSYFKPLGLGTGLSRSFETLVSLFRHIFAKNAAGKTPTAVK